ncbi:MAG: hypothetical protein M1819_001602 [Sarea resinae]|nr:MAG: hypothetical protein M1819_001602 [Sarea resinae]
MDTTTPPFIITLPPTSPHSGTLKGLTFIDHLTNTPRCHRLTGIPYALPPTGARRWKKPEPLPAGYSYGTEEQPGDFTKMGPICPQPPFSLDPDGPAMPQPAGVEYDEDCLRVNVWIPAGEPPVDGWPVYFYIHGGFLQYGSPNLTRQQDPADLISSTSVKAIFVLPAYRLNIFGFLASEELRLDASGDQVSPSDVPAAGNFGFYDQRLALEWTHSHISHFGGNAADITVGGYSAGAHSAFYQLAHELALPVTVSQPPIIRRVILLSNSSGPRPKSLSETRPQFSSLLAALSIPASLPPREKLSRLRALPSATLLAALKSLPARYRSFRSVSDDAFIPPRLFSSLSTGAFAALARQRRIGFLIGHVAHEENFYGLMAPVPSSYVSLVERLSAEFARPAVEAVLPLYLPASASQRRLSSDLQFWADLYGRVYSDLQIHIPQRGLLAALSSAYASPSPAREEAEKQADTKTKTEPEPLDPQPSIHRYTIAYRTLSADLSMPRELGVTHGTDTTNIWFYPRSELSASEQAIVKTWVESTLGGFLATGTGGFGSGDVNVGGGVGTEDAKEQRQSQTPTQNTDIKHVRTLMPDGTIRDQTDERWGFLLAAWRVLLDVAAAQEKGRS